MGFSLKKTLKSYGDMWTGIAHGDINESLGGYLGTMTAGLTTPLFENGTRKSGGGSYSYRPSDITAGSLFTNLSREQQKDLLLNNPTINTPQGGQSYDPYSNSINLNESAFTKAERLRQEGLASQLSSSLSGDFSNNGQAIQDATFNRGKAQIDPIIKQQRRDLATQLADQGIPAGSEGYNEAMNRLDNSIARQYTDLSQASIQTSEAVRSQRFNEIASLLGRSQVGAGSSFGQNQGANFSGLDLFGAEQSALSFNRQSAFQNDQNRLMLRQQNKNAQYSALGSLGGAAIGAFSDRNLKENIKKIGISEKGFDIYEFEYKNKDLGQGIYQGVMAQDLLQSKPEAVISDSSGFLSVDYSLIDVEFKRIQ
jgi:hypothetical protein